MGNDLAWWSAISAAAEAGCHDFDFWGVPPPDAGPGAPLARLGVFKSEFGGEQVAYRGRLGAGALGRRPTLVGLETKARAYVRGLKRNIP